jgi:hypothetical protein
MCEYHREVDCYCSCVAQFLLMEQLLKTTIGDPNANEFDLKLKELMMHT